MNFNSSRLGFRSAGKLILSIGVVLCVAIPWMLLAQTASYDVTTIIYDSSTPTGAADLMLRSDGMNPPSTGGFGGTYVSTPCGRGKCGNVSSRVSNTGERLDLFNQTQRTVFLHFVACSFQPANPTICAPDGRTPAVSDGYYSQYVELGTRCEDGANQFIDFLSISPGVSYNHCLLILDFGNNAAKYKLVMGPYFPVQGNDQPKTGWVTVTCTTPPAVPAVPCSSWHMAPYTDAVPGNYPNAAALYRFDKKGLTLLGYYVGTFRMDMTLP